MSILGAISITLTAAMVALDLFAPVLHYGVIRKYCREYSVNPSLVLSVIWTESKFRASAVSGAGAVGLMQLLPTTAEFVADMIDIPFEEDKLSEPEYNIRLGIKYLDYLSGRFSGDYILAAYNAGEGRVASWQNGEIPISETAKYVRRVKFMQRIYSFRTGS